MRHGLVYDLDEQAYHADRDSLSHSGAKVLVRAPALFRWQQDNPVHKDIFDLGSAAHRLVLGAGPDIAVIPATSRLKADQAAHKEAKDKAHAEGKIPVTAEDYQRVTDMADALTSNNVAMRLLSDGKPEVSAYVADEKTGVLRRCRFDYLRPGVVVDFKTAASVDPRDLAGRYGAVRRFSYDGAAAWYIDMARDLDQPVELFAWIFQMKEPPYLSIVAYVDDADLWEARERNRLALEMFRDCTASGYWPGYLPDGAAARLSLTDQTYEVETIQ